MLTTADDFIRHAGERGRCAALSGPFAKPMRLGEGSGRRRGDLVPPDRSRAAEGRPRDDDARLLGMLMSARL
jgi:hypothetical protein